MDIKTKAPAPANTVTPPTPPSMDKTPEQRKAEVRSIKQAVLASPTKSKPTSDWKPCKVNDELFGLFDNQPVMLGDVELGLTDLSKAVSALDNKGKETIILSSARSIDVGNINGYHVRAKYTLMATKV